MELRHKGRQVWRYCHVFVSRIISLNCFVPIDCVMWLGRRAAVARSWSSWCFYASCSQMAFSRPRSACFWSWSDQIYCSFMSVSIWRIWIFNNDVGWTLAAAPWGEEEPVFLGTSYRSTADGETVPLMVLLVLSLTGHCCVWRSAFSVPSALGKRIFMEGFELDGKETLSVNSDLNESTNLWWIKISLPWIGLTISDWRSYFRWYLPEHTRKRMSFRLGAPVCCRLMTLGSENQ